MKYIKNLITVIFVVVIVITGCTKDLEIEPVDPNTETSDKVFKAIGDYESALAKIYASYALSGQRGAGGGLPDIQGIDENFGNYLRQLFGLQELPTDEAIMAWDDATIKNFHWHTWAPNDVFITALYSRIFYSITLANEFVRISTDGMSSFSGSDKTNLEYYQAEARFLRAFSYWHAIDLFGNVPFITEADEPGDYYPPLISRSDLFSYIESELLDMESKLGPAGPGAFDYAAANRAAAWMLLAKLYLNAEVYTGTARYSDAISQLEKVIAAGYTLDPIYENVFRADNHSSPEIIYPIAFDGQNTQQYGGMTFILHASNGGGMPLNGIDGGWGGIRTIQDFVAKFDVSESDFSTSDPQYTNISDKRGMFYFDPENWQWNITNVGTFTHGIGITKFKNISSDGGEAPNAHPTFVSTDFPVFRLADAYLMYAEASLRGGGGNVGTALGYVNALRERAYGDNSANINSNELTLDFILDERGRELYWECHRRTDLIRFGKFTGGDYVWEWKGNEQAGTATPAYRDLYPIPANDLNANPNLKQNTGYVKE